MADLRQNIRAFILNSFLFGTADGLMNDSSFLEAGIIDSTGVIELVSHIETTYGVTVKDEELIPENLDSIDAIATYLENKISGAGYTA